MKAFVGRVFVLGLLAWAELLSPSKLDAQSSNDPTSLGLKAASRGDFSVKVYRMPLTELEHEFITKNDAVLQAPKLPDDDAKKTEIIKFLKNSHEITQQFLFKAGLPLPEGSLVVADPGRSTLVVRTTAEMHNEILRLAQDRCNRVAVSLMIQLHLVEADGSLVREMLHKSIEQNDHAALLNELRSSAKATDIDTLHIVTRSGMRVKASSVTEFSQSTGYISDKPGRSESEKESWPYGTTFYADPVLGPDGKTVDINFTIKHDYAPPVERWETIAWNGPEKLQALMVDTFQAKYSSVISMLAGTTRLVSVWKPEGTRDVERENKLQAAFLKANAVMLLPSPNLTLEKWVREEGPALKVEVITTGMNGQLIPSGMIYKRFQVPPDFLGCGDNHAVSDPVDPFAPVGQTDAHLSSDYTVKDVLISIGIPFPEGATAVYDRTSNELIILNMPKNIELIGQYVGDNLTRRYPAQIVSTLYIVQADASFLRKLAEQVITEDEQSEVWSEIEGKAKENPASIKWLNTMRQETRSGLRSAIQAGPIYLNNTEVSSSEEKFQEAEDDQKNDKDHGQVGTQEERALAAFAERRFAGTGMEIDPVFGADGRTVDLNLDYQYHMAPPTFAEGQASDLKLNSPQVHYHRGSFTASGTWFSGTTRMINIWKPRGSAELENADVLQAAFLRVDVVPVE